MRVEGVEPPRREALDPKSSMSTSSIIPALKELSLFLKRRKDSIIFYSLVVFDMFFIWFFLSSFHTIIIEHANRLLVKESATNF